MYRTITREEREQEIKKSRNIASEIRASRSKPKVSKTAWSKKSKSVGSNPKSRKPWTVVDDFEDIEAKLSEDIISDKYSSSDEDVVRMGSFDEYETIYELEQLRDTRIQEIVQLRQAAMKIKHLPTKFPQSNYSDISLYDDFTQSDDELDSPVNDLAYTRRVYRERTTAPCTSRQDSVFTIRERRRQEMLKEIKKKKMEEEDELKVRFKARPIPTSTLLPKYEKLRQAMEAKSLSR